jgi:hypothetical protein
MNTTKIAVMMFGSAAASLFLANFHLRHELVSLNTAIKERGDYIMPVNLPEVTIISKKPATLSYMGKANTSNDGQNPFSRKTFNPEKGMITFTYKPQPDIFKIENNIETFNTNPTKGIVFRVQIITSGEPIPLFSCQFEGLNDIREYYSNGVYKYTVGSFIAPGQSSPLFDKLRAKGFSDAFLVAFKDDKRVNIEEAMKEKVHVMQVSRFK